MMYIYSRPKLSQLETIKAKIMCEVDRCLKEISTSEDCEREIHVLQMERDMHMEAISTLDKDIKEVISAFDKFSQDF